MAASSTQIGFVDLPMDVFAVLISQLAFKDILKLRQVIKFFLYQSENIFKTKVQQEYPFHYQILVKTENNASWLAIYKDLDAYQNNCESYREEYKKIIELLNKKDDSLFLEKRAEVILGLFQRSELIISEYWLTHENEDCSERIGARCERILFALKQIKKQNRMDLLDAWFKLVDQLNKKYIIKSDRENCEFIKILIAFGRPVKEILDYKSKIPVTKSDMAKTYKELLLAIECGHLDFIKHCVESYPELFFGYHQFGKNYRYRALLIYALNKDQPLVLEYLADNQNLFTQTNSNRNYLTRIERSIIEVPNKVSKKIHKNSEITVVNGKYFFKNRGRVLTRNENQRLTKRNGFGYPYSISEKNTTKPMSSYFGPVNFALIKYLFNRKCYFSHDELQWFRSAISSDKSAEQKQFHDILAIYSECEDYKNLRSENLKLYLNVINKLLSCLLLFSDSAQEQFLLKNCKDQIERDFFGYDFSRMIYSISSRIKESIDKHCTQLAKQSVEDIKKFIAKNDFSDFSKEIEKQAEKLNAILDQCQRYSRHQFKLDLSSIKYALNQILENIEDCHVLTVCYLINYERDQLMKNINHVKNIEWLPSSASSMRIPSLSSLAILSIQKNRSQQLQVLEKYLAIISRCYRGTLSKNHRCNFLTLCDRLSEKYKGTDRLTKEEWDIFTQFFDQKFNESFFKFVPFLVALGKSEEEDIKQAPGKRSCPFPYPEIKRF